MQSNVADKPQEEAKKNPAKKNKLLRIANIFLMVLVLWFLFVLCIVLVSRDSLVAMSKEYFEDSTLMGSILLNHLLHREFIVVPIMTAIAMVVKEFKVKILRNRIYINLIILLCVSGYLGLLFYLMFQPVLMQ